MYFPTNIKVIAYESYENYQANRGHFDTNFDIMKSEKNLWTSGVASLIIEGVHIHIFVFTDRKNNTFQKGLITQNTNIWISTPSIIDLSTPLVRTSFHATYPCSGWLDLFSCLGLATPLLWTHKLFLVESSAVAMRHYVCLWKEYKEGMIEDEWK